MLAQVVLIALGFVTYFGVRALAEGAHAQAFANAGRVMRLEDALGIGGAGPAGSRRPPSSTTRS